MKMSRATVCLVVASMLMLAALGCGSGSSTPPPAGAVAASTHPLVAQYTVSHFDSGLSAWVEFGTDTNYGRQTSVTTSSSTGLAIQNVNVLVAGMLPKTTYHMRAHASWASGSWVDQDRTFTTGALPVTSTSPQFAAFSVSTPTAGLTPAPGVELLSLVPGTGTGIVQDVVTDTKGRVIWYCPLNGVPLKPMRERSFYGEYWNGRARSRFDMQHRARCLYHPNESSASGGRVFVSSSESIPPRHAGPAQRALDSACSGDEELQRFTWLPWNDGCLGRCFDGRRPWRQCGVGVVIFRSDR